jgi:hypothetical protein
MTTYQANVAATPASFLRRVLLGNAAFGVVSGLVCLLWAQPLATALGLAPPWIVTGLGVGLLLFAAELAWIALRAPENRRVVTTIFALDVAWVVASVIVLFSSWAPPTPVGTWVVVIVADIVAVFAVLEFIGLRRLRG